MLITTEYELKDLIAKALLAPAVGLDTEFVWERTFYPCLGLVQLAIEQECYLIDPVAINDLSSLGKLISEPSVTKILHDAQQDLMILQSATGAEPKNIFDTRLAYGFCSDSSILSLSALLERTLNISLPKTETRANWLMRPLTGKMVEYACDDVKYLTELMNFIITGAEKQNTGAWLEEELKIYDDPSLYAEIDPREYFRKIKGIEQLKGVKLAVLRELAAWREETARERNRPRGHILHNNVLLKLAYKCPASLDGLNKIDRLSPKNIKMYGEDLLKCIERGMHTPPELQPAPVSRLIKKKASAVIYGLIEKKASELNIDPALICSRRELTMLLDSGVEDLWMFKGWRNEFMLYVCENTDMESILKS